MPRIPQCGGEEGSEQDANGLENTSQVGEAQLIVQLKVKSRLDALYAEILSSDFELPEGLSRVEQTKALIDRGVCVPSAKAVHHVEAKLFSFEWKGNLGGCFKQGNSIVISRSHPEEDAHKGILKVRSIWERSRKIKGITLEGTSHVPWDVLEGTWRIDVHEGHEAEYQMAAQVKYFCEGNGLLQELILGDGSDREALNRVTREHPSDVSTHMVDLSRFRLNADQLKAVELCGRHVVTLIEGPPGTGKSQTAAAIASVFYEQRPHDCALVAPSHEAVNNLASRCQAYGVPIWRTGHVSRCCSELEQHSLEHKAESTWANYNYYSDGFKKHSRRRWIFL